MYEQVLAWVGLVLLLALCLPLAGIQKLVLEVYSGVLRLALLALLGTGAYLWFRPDQLPGEVTDTLSNFAWLRDLLPQPETPYFGICAAALVVVVLLPLLAVLDVCRKLAGGRLRRLRALTAGPAAEAPSPASAPQRGPSPAPHRIDRRAAADTMAEAASRQPLRVANRLRQ
jgi:4-amino-4-deoxy-L-arabinose transferase-like glycosyltransferase